MSAEAAAFQEEQIEELKATFQRYPELIGRCKNSSQVRQSMVIQQDSQMHEYTYIYCVFSAFGVVIFLYVVILLSPRKDGHSLNARRWFSFGTPTTRTAEAWLLRTLLHNLQAMVNYRSDVARCYYSLDFACRNVTLMCYKDALSG